MEDSISFASNHAKASRYRKLENRVQELTDRLLSVDKTVEELSNRHFTCDDVKPYQAKSNEEKQVSFVDEEGDTDVETAVEDAVEAVEAEREAAEAVEKAEEAVEEAKEATAKVEEDVAKHELDSDDSYYDDEDAEIALEPTLEGGSDSNVPSLLELAKELDTVKEAVMELSRRLGSVPNLQKQICDLSKQVVGAHPSFVAC